MVAWGQQTTSLDSIKTALQKGQLDRAQSLLEAFLSQNPNHIEAQFYQAELYYLQEDWGAALRTYEKVLSLDPQHKEALFKKGMCQFRLKDYRGAEATFLRITQNQKDPADAYFGLGMVYAYRPKSRFRIVADIQKIFKKDDWSQAIHYFRKALEIRPDFLKAKYQLGLALLERGTEKNLKEAKKVFQEIAQQHPEYDDIFFYIGLVHHKLREFSEAIRVLKNLIKIYPHHGKAKVQLARIYFQLNEGKLGSTYFMDGLEDLTDERMLRELFLETEMIMAPSERKTYKALPLSERGKFLKRFWLSRDPDLTTEVNERLVEHYRRINYARAHFRSKDPIGFDDRGLIYVKYGEPDERFISAVSLSQASKGNESWVYRNLSKDGSLTFDFVERGTAYRLAMDLTEAVASGGSFDHRIWQATRLYRERAHIDPFYAMTATELENAWSVNERHRARDYVRELISKREMAVKTAPPDRYDPFAKKEKLLPLIHRMAQFRDKGDSTRIEFYYVLFHNKVAFQPYFNRDYRAYLTSNYALLDSNYVPIYRETRSVSLRTPSLEETRKNFSVNQHNLRAKPGEYILSFRIEDPESKRLATYQSRVKVRDFTGSSLQLSDIQFAFDIRPAKSGDRFVKHGLKVTPFPFHVVKKNKPIFIYYEIYNLKKDATGKTHYRVEYKVEILKEKAEDKSVLSRTVKGIGRLFRGKKQKFISSVYEREGMEKTGIEYISLDLRKLPSGTCELSVIVTDLNSGEKAQAVTQFELER